MNCSKIAADILRLVGGKENVASVTNCMTRLRFQLKDHKKADVEALKRLDGVQGVVTKNGQFQVVIGTDVGDVCMKKPLTLHRNGLLPNTALPKQKKSTFFRGFSFVGTAATKCICNREPGHWNANTPTLAGSTETG